MRKMQMSDGGSVSSNDVAKLAGVSRASVTRAFSNSAAITPETRQRVLEAARRLGYQPNAIAQSLIKGTSSIVGIVIADLANPFYASLLNALCQNLQQRGFGALVLAASGMEDVDALIPRLLSFQVHGMLIASSVQSSQIALQCVQAKRRVVLVNRDSDLPSISAVCCDNYLGGQLAATHLLDMRCTRFAFLAGSDATMGSAKREHGFADALRAAGLVSYAKETGNYNYHSAAEAARRLLSRKERPDAIFCANDIMALATLDVARREYGMSVPQDLALVGFDNTPLSAVSGYDMTSIDQDIPALTAMAVKKLLDESEKDHRQSVLIPCRIEIRGSSQRSALEN